MIYKHKIIPILLLLSLIAFICTGTVYIKQERTEETAKQEASEKLIKELQQKQEENSAYIKEIREFMQKLNVGEFTATSYAPSAGGINIWKPLNASRSYVPRTSTGSIPCREIFATDPNIIPLGSKMWVEGYGYGVAGDTGGAIIGNRVDVFAETYTEAMEWGKRSMRVIWIEA